MKKSAEKHDAVSGSRVNQLGGSYRNGKPLSPEMRRKVIDLSLSGVRPCEISRMLKITHGCISKLLSKFFKTGSLVPGHGTAGRPRVITPWIERHIDRYRKEHPGIFSWEIRERLLRENVCFETSLPSLSSINRVVKSKIKQQSFEREGRKGNNKQLEDDYKNINNSKMNCKHTIENILSDAKRTPVHNFYYEPMHVTCSSSYENQSTEEEDSHDSMEDWTTRWTFEDNNNKNNFFHPSVSSVSSARRKRIIFSRYQIKCLEKEFEMNPYPSHTERDNISKVLVVDEPKVKVWFSNRRAKDKRRVSPVHTNYSLPFPLTTSRVCHPYDHINNSVIFPRQLNAGPSRLFFPPGYRPVH